MRFSEAKADKLVGIILGAISILLYFVIIPWQIADTKATGVSPRFLPEMISLLLLFLSVVLYFNGKRKQDRPDQAEYVFSSRETILVIKSLLVIAVYIITFELLGYLVPTVLIMAALMFLYGQRKLKVLIPVSVGLPLAIYAFFTYILKIVLP